MDDEPAVTHEDGGGAREPAPRQRLAHLALLVRDYDEAIAWFVDRLGFHVVEDTPLAPGKRWVLVAPPGDAGTTLLLARAATPDQQAAVGRQGGGRVFLFLHTDDFARDHAALTARGVVFSEAPRHEAYGVVAVFEDLYGNRWDLVQPRPPAAPAPSIEIRHEPPAMLAEYARVPIAFEVREVLAVVAPDAGLGGLHLVASPMPVPYVKDYDAEPDQHPTRWPLHFDTSRWGILSAWIADERVGGAVVAWDTAGLDLMDGRTDLAVLWDLRVAPARRGRGVGAALLEAAERWAAAHGARWLSVETQNVNVPACRFYARHGCTLGAMHRHAYPTLPHETQLRWYKPLGAPAR